MDRALAGEVVEARGLLEEAGKPGPLVDAHVLPLAQAAIVWAEGRRSEAVDLLDKARKALPSSMDGAAKWLDGARIRELRAPMDERPGQRGPR